MRNVKVYFKSESGNMATIFAIVLLVLVISIGAAVDYARAERVDFASQDIADAMVLAAATELAGGGSKQDAQKVAFQAFEENSLSQNGNAKFDRPELKIDRDSNIYLLHANVSGKLPTTFMSVIGKKEMGFAATAKSEVQLNSIEVALVVDVSWSMKNGKIDPMKTALIEFLDVLYPNKNFSNNRTVSVIPYADTVHFGNKYRHWLKRDDPPVPVTITRSDGSTYTVRRHLEPTNSQMYRGCFQHEPNGQIQTGRTPYLRPGNYLSYVQSYAVGTPFCPSRKSQVQLFQTKPEKLKKAIKNLDLGFGTSTDIGTVWGWRVLSPSWRRVLRGGAYPKPFKEENIKHLIILTDGKSSRADPVGDGKSVRSVSREPATSNFIKLCDSIKREDKIHVTTIAYGFSEKEKAMQSILEKCVSKEGRFYAAGTKDIGNILSSIARSLTKIRLVE